MNGENGTARNVHYGDILIKFGDCLDGERSDLPFITDDTVLPKFTGSILREGDVIFADTAEDEAAGKCVELRKLPKEPTISGLHTIPARPRFPFGTGYLGHYLNSDAYHRQLLPLMQGIKVISVSKASLQDTQVRFPGLSEQTAIGAALSEIDALITLHQRKYDKLCTVKKSMLDKMFPKPGETEPEIRFEGFTDPWEQRKLGDLISVYIAHAGPEEDVTVLTSSRDGIQKQEDHFGRLQQHDTSDWNLIPYGYCTYRNRSDDGLFTFNVNKVADRGIVSKFYPVFETPECDADFLVAYLNSSQEIRKKLFVLAVGTSQVVLSYGALKELSLLLPQNREQSAIANVLNHIDNLITLHQRMGPIFCFCAHGSRTNFASTLQG